MPFCNVSCILPTAIPALDVVVIIGGGRRRQIREFTPFGLDSFDLFHSFDSILKLLMLDFPFGFLLFTKDRF
jgi:hypothetical protein